MKKTILLLIALTAIVNLPAQEYIPFPPDSTSEWRIDESNWNPNPWEITYYNKRFFFNGEIILGNKVFKRLFSSGEVTTEWSNGTTTTSYFENMHEADVRNEGSKVFIFQNNNEHLLFDYAFQAGDTITDCYITNYCDDPLVISSVDSVLIGTRYHLKYNINNPWGGNASWFIEGIGHELGIFQIMCMVPDYGSSFLCYAENHEPIFPPDVVCDLTVDIEEPEPTQTIFEISPNPSPGNINFSFNSKRNQQINLQILDITGRTIMSVYLYVGNGVNVKTLNLHSLQNGIYFILLKNEMNEAIGRKKIILQK